jgi:hypothetical protein
MKMSLLTLDNHNTYNLSISWRSHGVQDGIIAWWFTLVSIIYIYEGKGKKGKAAVRN